MIFVSFTAKPIMIQVKIGEKLHKKLNNNRLGIILSNVKVGPAKDILDQEIQNIQDEKFQLLQTKRESELNVIQETRSAYKICGKEPSRYRPSAEALLRRIRTQKSLYQINNVVDAINLISISTHYSIGGFDFENISGPIQCEIGNAEPYEAIGRGVLNIEFMPGLRDSLGFFGTPTSDSVRTMVTETTTQLLLVFYDFFENETLEESMEYASQMLQRHCSGELLSSFIFKD